jgi:hypothetical protein
MSATLTPLTARMSESEYQKERTTLGDRKHVKARWEQELVALWMDAARASEEGGDLTKPRLPKSLVWAVFEPYHGSDKSRIEHEKSDGVLLS